jgi:tRNA uridine 5-carboxymethylaminomethyl modification enzyme
MKYGYQFGLIDKQFYDRVRKRESIILSGIDLCSRLKLHANDVNDFLLRKGSSPIESTETLSKLCKRPELSLSELIGLNGYHRDEVLSQLINDTTALEQVEIELKYEGYFKRQQETIERLERYEDATIPLMLNYSSLKSLSAEAKEKLSKVKPRSIGQASRLSGVTPSDISILLVYLKS